MNGIRNDELKWGRNYRFFHHNIRSKMLKLQILFI